MILLERKVNRIVKKLRLDPPNQVIRVRPAVLMESSKRQLTQLGVSPLCLRVVKTYPERAIAAKRKIDEASELVTKRYAWPQELKLKICLCHPNLERPRTILTHGRNKRKVTFCK